MTYNDLHYDYQGGNYHELMDKLLACALQTENSTLIGIHNEFYRSLLERIRSEVVDKVAAIRNKSREYPHSQESLDIVLKYLTKFAEQTDPVVQQQPRKFKQVAYHLELAQKLEWIDWQNHNIDVFSPDCNNSTIITLNSFSYCLTILQS